MSESLASRGHEFDELGPCDDRLDVPVPARMKEDAAFMARVSGFRNGTAEYVRWLIYRDLYGQLKAAEIMARRGMPGNGRGIG